MAQMAHGNHGWAVWALLTGAHHHRPAGNAERFILSWRPDGTRSGVVSVDIEALAASGGGSSTEAARIRLALSLLDGKRWPVDLNGTLILPGFDDRNVNLLTEALALALSGTS